jgi:hypothetical protein
MTDQIGHVKVLTNVIEKLVDERRALAVSMMLGHKRRRTDDTQTNDMRNTFIEIQNTIEAVERAAEHERSTTYGAVEASVVRTLQAAPDLAPA